MPTYAYHCEHCNADIELFHSMSEPAKTDCPQCHHSSLKKVISGGAGIIFKGTGFYQTDYKPVKEPSASTTTESNASKPCKNKDACSCAS